MIIAHWEPPVIFSDGQLKKYFVQWTHTAKAFGVHELAFVEVDPMPEFGDQEVRLHKYPCLDSAVDGREVVYVEHGGASMADYSFPENPVFVFGSDYGVLPRADLEIPAGPLHAHVACGVVLSHWRAQWP